MKRHGGTDEMTATSYRFHLELFTEDGRAMGDIALKHADFQRAIYATCFGGLRADVLESYQPAQYPSTLDPIFQESDTPSAQLAGFRVTIASPNEFAQDFDASFFASRAVRMRQQLTRQGQLEPAEKLLYRLTAYLDDEAEEVATKQQISLGTADFQLDLRTSSLSHFAPLESWDVRCEDDIAVVIDREVVETAVAEARAAPQQEIGGFLLGHVCRNPDTREIFVTVSGWASGADTTEADLRSITFTPASFQRARELIRLRGAGEVVIGWYHSHPFKLCEACPLPTPPECIDKVLFFSQDDIAVMEETFDQPYVVGLLAAVDERIERALGHLPVRLFGWRKGQVVHRGFEVCEELYL